VKYPNEFIIPPTEIEAVWQAHLIRPDKYQETCTVIFNQKLIPHSIETMPCMKTKGREKCRELWRQEYHVEEESDINNNSDLNIPANLQEIWNNFNLNLKVEDIVKDRDWLPLYRMYTETIKSEKFDSFLAESVKGYYRFLDVCKNNLSSSTLEPCYAIDLIWHTHMMHPAEYQQYCQKNLLRELLVHEPWPPRFTSQQMFDNLDEMDVSWKALYGESIHDIRNKFATPCNTCTTGHNQLN